MTNFLDLPEEIILNVVQYLRPRPRPYSGPFSSWPYIVLCQIDSHVQDETSLRRLSLCNRYLFDLLGSIIYSYPLIDTTGYMSSFLKALNTHQGLGAQITHAYVSYPKVTTEDLCVVFNLPNVHTITITDFCARSDDDFRADLFGTSSVQVLRLIDCKTIGTAFANLLRLPANLRELSHESDGEQWYNRSDRGISDPSQACLSFESALATQNPSLEKLVVSRCDHQTKIVPNDGHLIDLRQFPNLKSFSIDYCDALEAMANIEIWKRLPPNLEELQIHYGNYRTAVYASWEPTWLYRLLGQEARRKHAPALKRVRIESLEWIEGPSPAGTAESHYLDDSDGKKKWAAREFWAPPSQVMQRFKDAGVSFSIYTDKWKHFRYVVEGEQGFGDLWEDTWTSPTSSLFAAMIESL